MEEGGNGQHKTQANGDLLSLPRVDGMRLVAINFSLLQMITNAS